MSPELNSMASDSFTRVISVIAGSLSLFSVGLTLIAGRNFCTVINTGARGLCLMADSITSIISTLSSHWVAHIDWWPSPGRALFEEHCSLKIDEGLAEFVGFLLRTKWFADKPKKKNKKNRLQILVDSYIRENKPVVWNPTSPSSQRANSNFVRSAGWANEWRSGLGLHKAEEWLHFLLV